jgi:hypothetical protein
MNSWPPVPGPPLLVKKAPILLGWTQFWLPLSGSKNDKTSLFYLRFPSSRETLTRFRVFKNKFSSYICMFVTRRGSNNFSLNCGFLTEELRQCGKFYGAPTLPPTVSVNQILCMKDFSPECLLQTYSSIVCFAILIRFPRSIVKRWLRQSTNLSSIYPNLHYFIAITKATACGWKEPVLPHPLHSPVGGRGRGLLPLRPWIFA